MELAIIIDFGMNFVKATYQLEADSPLVFQCYEVISTLIASVTLAVISLHLPKKSAAILPYNSNSRCMATHVYSLLSITTTNK